MTESVDFRDLIERLQSVAQDPHPSLGSDPGRTILIDSALRIVETGQMPETALNPQARALVDFCESILGDDRLNEFNEHRVEIQADRVYCTYFGLIEWLLHRTQEVGAERAIIDVAEYLASDTLSYEIVTVLGAVEVADIAEVSDRILLTPWTPPPLPQPVSQPIAQSMMRLGWMCPAAIVRHDNVPRKHRPGDEEQSFDPHFFDDIDDAIHSMTVCGPSGAYVAGRYIRFAPNIPLPPSGLMSVEPEVRGARRETFSAAAGKLLRAVFPLFRSLRNDAREALLLPIGRLNLGMRRQTLLDMAIELGIAMESFFLHEAGKKRARGQITQRLASRAAGLLGATARERKQLAELFVDAYGLRSEGVHRASFKHLSTTEQNSAKSTLYTAYACTAEALRKAVMQQNQFDWQTIASGAIAEAEAAIRTAKQRS